MHTTITQHIQNINITHLQIISIAISLLNITLGIKQKTITWPINITITTLNTIIHYKTLLYDKLITATYTTLFSIYGWYKWKNNKKTKQKLPITKITKKNTLTYTIIFTTTLLTIKTILKHTNADQQQITSIRSSLTILGIYLTANKKLQSYTLWTIVNIISTYICYQKKLYPFTIKYTIYTILSIYGYKTWNTQYKKQNNK